MTIYIYGSGGVYNVLWLNTSVVGKILRASEKNPIYYDIYSGVIFISLTRRSK